MNWFCRLATSAAVALAFASLALQNARAVTIDWVTVGDPGNAADTTGFGAVSGEFQIGKYEVTIQQYTDFLNAVAKSDPYSLWSPGMTTGTTTAGISRAGSSGSYTYSVIGPAGATPAGANSPGNRPISFVTWFDAARFTNWMNNGQLSGTAGAASAETGAYALNGVTTGTAIAPNPGAQYYLPTADQWYKAAYYKGGGTNAGYWAYPTQSDTAPGNVIGSGTNQANYLVDIGDNNGILSVTQLPYFNGYTPTQNYLTNVGAFTNSPGPYGTFDMAGNVMEWIDYTVNGGTTVGVRGGNWVDPSIYLESDFPGAMNPSYDEEGLIGFRLATAVVPEPSTYAMALAGLACGGYSMFRRRKRD
jgi:formylglycine-generating enzyme required for sulfatase activity